MFKPKLTGFYHIANNFSFFEKKLSFKRERNPSEEAPSVSPYLKFTPSNDNKKLDKKQKSCSTERKLDCKILVLGNDMLKF